MGQIRFKCLKTGETKEQFPESDCWTCVSCSDKGNKLFKEFLVNEVFKGHIYHMLRPNPDSSYSIINSGVDS